MANFTVELNDDELEYLMERIRDGGGDVRNIVANYLRFGTEIYDDLFNKVVEEVQTELAKPKSYTVVIREIKTYQVNLAYDNSEKFFEEAMISIDEGEGELLENEREIISVEED